MSGTDHVYPEGRAGLIRFKRGLSPVLALAKEAGITEAEAEARLARALVYYTDAGWRTVIDAKSSVPDDTTLKYLAIALAPLADTYDVTATVNGFPVLSDNKSYTPEETARLLQNYSVNHPEAYADNRLNGDYLNPNFNYIPKAEDFRNLGFYEKNLNFRDGFGDFATGVLTGSAQGYWDATTGMATNFWTLGSSLLSHPVDATSQIANGLLLSMASPDRLWSSYRNNKNDVEILTYLYQLQGNTAASAAVRAKYDTEMAINLVPAGRIGKLGEVGAGAKGFFQGGTGAFLEGAEGGGALGKLTDRQVNISDKGLSIVETHLAQFGSVPENDLMISRLRSALAEGRPIDGADASFYIHELSESTMMMRGFDYSKAHQGALNKYQVSPYSVYHPDVINAINAIEPGSFNPNWLKFWSRQ